jgi:diguanylate cyclase (GGDEF)-like protein
MLAQFIESDLVFIAIVENGEPYLEYAYDHGKSIRDAHSHIGEGAQTRRVLARGTSLLIAKESDLGGPRVAMRVPGGHHDDSSNAIFVPLRVGPETIGVLSVQSSRSNIYTDEDVRLLETCALYLAVAIQADRVQRHAYELISEQAIDAVTGIATRRVFDERLHDDWMRARRDSSPLAMLLLDVDFFKRFNDTYGHVAGDACLRQVAQSVRGTLSRDTDLLARYGGEEFAAILWGTDAAGALAAAERMRQSIADLDIPHAGSETGRLSISIGVACAAPNSASPETLVRAADRALYAAKTSGRDRCVMDQFESLASSKGARAATNNLRPPGTSFHGRAAEITDLLQALQEARIVTIVGPGGIGKTRTSVAAAQRRLYAYLDGVWFIDFQGIKQPEFVDGAVGAVTGASQHGALTERDALLAELANSNMLLVFDNCEHLREPIAHLCEAIVRAAPQVTILATSREALHAQGERLFVLSALEPQTALALFTDRARATFPAFTLDDSELEIARTIVEKLDHLPLAIELAAPRVKTMNLADLLASLEDRFRLLVSSKREVGERHRALHATIEWSFDLLDAPGRHLLENISVFPATIDPDAVRDICADAEIEPWDLPGALNDLVEKNLVTVQTSSGAERYTLLESTRAFARMQLELRPDAQSVAQRHVRYYRALARRVGEYQSKGSIEAAILLGSSEWENLRGALERALSGQLDVDAGRAMVLSLSGFWAEAGRLSDATYWCDCALASVSDDKERSDLLYAAALIAHSRGDFKRLGDYALELVGIHERSGNVGALAKSHNALGNAYFKTGRPQEAEVLYRKGLEEYRIAGDKRGIAVALMNLGSLIADWKLDYAAAREYFEESLAIFRGFGTSANTGIVLANLGEVQCYEGNYNEAISFATEALAVFERLGNKALAAWQLLDLARYDVELGKLGDAVRSMRLARRYLHDEPASEHHAGFFDVAFHLAYESGAKELAAKLAGYLARYRHDHAQPRAPSDEPMWNARYKKLQASLDDGSFAMLTRAGAFADSSALQDEVEALAP